MDYARTMVSDVPMLQIYIATARDVVEQETGKALINQQWRLYLESWNMRPRPLGVEQSIARPFLVSDRDTNYVRFQEVRLPRSPLISVQSVQYYDTSGSLQTLDPSTYTIKPSSRSSHGGIVLALGASWPSVASRPDAIQINFTAGHASAAAIPPKLIQAMLFLIMHYVDEKHPIINERGVTPQILPHGVDSLLTSERVEFVA